MKLTATQLPDKRYYETYTEEMERNIRLRQLRAERRTIEVWDYKSANWHVYFVIYK